MTADIDTAESIESAFIETPPLPQSLPPQVVRPAAAWELASLMADASADARSVRIAGSGTKDAVGRLPDADLIVQTTSLRGLSDYAPETGMVRILAGTTVGEVEVELARIGRMVPSEFLDLAPLFGFEPGSGTLGGTLAAGFEGHRAVAAGRLCRHLRDLVLITGDGRELRQGAQSGSATGPIALASRLAGSWGRLGAITEVVLETAPLPEASITLVLRGLTDDLATAALSDALRADCGVTGGAHIDAHLIARTPGLEGLGATETATLLRLEGRTDRVGAAMDTLTKALAIYGTADLIGDAETADLWREINRLASFVGSGEPLWRIAVSPSRMAGVLATIRRAFDAAVMIDGAGRTAWVEL
ncbi:MAG: FAD-binding protein, partial [Pseudomonadota bacterium]